MTKQMILAAMALSFLLGGCAGKREREITELPRTTPTEGEQPGIEPGDADRPERGTVEGEALADLETIYFDFDKYNLREDAKRALDQNAEILRANPDIRILIEGHCDERGTNEYNLALGERRARAARDYLVRLGIDPSRISIISYGEERPVALGHDEESWWQNRRGEFVPK